VYILNLLITLVALRCSYSDQSQLKQPFVFCSDACISQQSAIARAFYFSSIVHMYAAPKELLSKTLFQFTSIIAI